MRIALVGRGRMGQAIGRLASDQGHAVVATISGAANAGGAGLTRAALADAEVVFEFTRPDAASANLHALATLGIPVVCGTTGWLSELPVITAAFVARRGALVHGPNFSIGVQLFLRAARDLAGHMRGQPFEGFITETHHAGKRDAPSGTALALADAVRTGDDSRRFPISSTRGGHAPGTHTVVFDAPFETIRLEHVARGREAFATGALAAGQWIIGREGVFTFADMLFGRTG